jgi:hypothetical protein
MGHAAHFTCGRAERGLTVGRGFTVKPQARPRGIVARIVAANQR